MNIVRRGFLMDEDKGDGDPGGGKDNDTPISPDIIAAATEMGWVPEDKWTGPKEKWVPADKYLARAERVLPIVLARNRDLSKQIKATQEQIAQIQADAKLFRDHTEKAVKAKYEGLLQEKLQEKIEAINESDGVRAVQLDGEIAELQRKQAEELKATAATVKKGDTDEHPGFTAWKAANPWYEADDDLQALADSQAIRLNRKNPTLVGRALFDEVVKEVKRLRPDKFEDNIDSRDNRVNSDRDVSRPAPRTGKGRTYNDLPPEAKAACDRFVANKWTTREQYVKDYQWD